MRLWEGLGPGNIKRYEWCFDTIEKMLVMSVEDLMTVWIQGKIIQEIV